MSAQPVDVLLAEREALIERIRCESRAGVFMRSCGLDAEDQREIIDAVLEAVPRCGGSQ